MTAPSAKAAHTALPWIIDDGLIRQEDMVETLKQDIGDTEREWVAVGIADEDGFAESVAYCHPANAELIVRAVNSHAEILECLTLALPSIEESEEFDKPHSPKLSKRVRELIESLS